MEHIVVDSSIIVAFFLEADQFHQTALPYIKELESGEYIFHLPMLVVVEVMAAICRRSERSRQALLARAEKSLREWDQDGRVVLYPLDRDRMTNAVNVAQRHRLRGSDAVMAALAEELSIPLRTFDAEINARFHRASV